MVVSLLVMHVSIAFIPTLLKLTRIHWLIGLSLNEAKTFLKVPVSIKVGADDFFLMVNLPAVSDFTFYLFFG